MSLNFGYFEAFKGEDTVLFHGGEEELLALAAVLTGLTEENTAQLAISDEENIKSHGIRLFGFAVLEDVGIERKGDDFFWMQTAGKWKEIAQSLSALALRDSPAHIYLDGPRDNVSIMASKNEYVGLFPPGDA